MTLCGEPHPKYPDALCVRDHDDEAPPQDHVSIAKGAWPNPATDQWLADQASKSPRGGRSRKEQMREAAANAKPDDRVGPYQLSDIVPGAYSPTGPQVSIDAALSVNVRGQAMAAYEAIRRRGQRGATGPEISNEVGLSVQLLSTRLQLLRDKGLTRYLLADDGEVVVRPGPSGREAMVQIAAEPAR